MFLTDVVDSVVRHLSAAEFFAGKPGEKAIPVIAANDRMVINKAKQATGSLGICVIVAPIGGEMQAHSAPIPHYRPARFTCRVRENPHANRAPSGTGQPAHYVAEVCADLLKHFQPDDGATPTPNLLTGGCCIIEEITPGEDEEAIVAWDCVFTCDGFAKGTAVRRQFSAAELKE